MNMKRILIATALSVLFFSCTKEKSVDTTDPDAPGGGGGGNPGQGLLARTVINLGTDSTVNAFTYDAQNRLVRHVVSGQVDLFTEEGEVKLVRNAQGIITSIVTKEQPGSATDSFVYKINYDAAGKRYHSKVSSDIFQGVVMVDSTAYTYNTAGRISAETLYFSIDGSAFAPLEKFEYTYNTAGNLVGGRISFLNPDNGDLEQEGEMVLEYDNKINPLNLGMEAILMDQILHTSANNVIRYQFTSFADPNDNNAMTFAYVYKADNKPESVVITTESVGVPLPMIFRYQ